MVPGNNFLRIGLNSVPAKYERSILRAWADFGSYPNENTYEGFGTFSLQVLISDFSH